MTDRSATGPGGLPYRPCAGVVLVDREGRVFAGRRIDSPAGRPAAWQMPQGGIDKGETPREAALRELVEETGVSPQLVTVEAETADWVTYDLPPELLGKAGHLIGAWRARTHRRPSWRIVMPFTLLAIDDAEHLAEALRARGALNSERE